METDAYTTRILLEASARSVSRTRNAVADEEARCGREVILVAAGAVKSPHLLELSGIGQPELLASLGIDGEARVARRR